MLYTRYRTARQRSQGKDVLEVACGPGLGLGYLAGTARLVVGGDYAHDLLTQAQRHYRGRIPLVQLDAHQLPVRDKSFDTVILYEAIYYLARPERFLQECRRILRPGGALLICCANRDWAGFSPSVLTHRYFSVPELHGILAQAGFHVEVFGAFPATARSYSGRVISFIRTVGVRLRLIPKTQRGKEFLKRLFYGRLVELRAEVEDQMGELTPLVPLLADTPTSAFKVLYAIGYQH